MWAQVAEVVRTAMCGSSPASSSIEDELSGPLLFSANGSSIGMGRTWKPSGGSPPDEPPGNSRLLYFQSPGSPQCRPDRRAVSLGSGRGGLPCGSFACISSRIREEGDQKTEVKPKRVRQRTRGCFVCQPADCTAVGSFDASSTGNGDYETLVESRDGTTWSQVASPNQEATGTNVLSRVSCTDSTDCLGGHVPSTAIPHCHGVTCSPATTLVETGAQHPHHPIHPFPQPR
jgi:hypothetical protein